MDELECFILHSFKYLNEFLRKDEVFISEAMKFQRFLSILTHFLTGENRKKLIGLLEINFENYYSEEILIKFNTYQKKILM